MFQSGQSLGVYTLIEKIGRGGVGEVWLAERRGLVTTKVAIKLPHEENVDIEAVRQEAELWARASGHPNVVPIIEANIYDEQVVIVSEYAKDGSLRNLLHSNPLISVRQATELITGILKGLQHLHSNEIIHRDLKPENILLQGDTPRLADFGISRTFSSTLSSDSSITGTPNYMAPEAFDGKRDVCTDIWSVGVIFYEILAGSQPFPQKQMTELMGAIIFKEYPPLPDFVPVKLRKVIDQSLSKKPSERQSSAQEMLDQLQNLAEEIQPLRASENSSFPVNSIERESLPENPYETKANGSTSLISHTVEVSPQTDKAETRRMNLGKQVPVFLAIGVLILGGITFFAWSKYESGEAGNLAVNSERNKTKAEETADLNDTSNQEKPVPTLDDWINKGNEEHRRREYKAAIDSYTKAIKINPDYSPVYNNRGVAYGDKGDYKKAMSDFEKALELDPANNTAKINLDNLRKVRR